MAGLLVWRQPGATPTPSLAQAMSGDGELTQMRKETGRAHDEVTMGQLETNHRSLKYTHTFREGKKRQRWEW